MIGYFLGLCVFLLGCGSSPLLQGTLLGKGEPCGGSVEGQCDANLTCLSVTLGGDKEETPRGKVCSPPLAPGCVPCSGVQCPRVRRTCPGGHVTEPCGCCPQCARQKGQVCGGPSWENGYCDRGLTCTLFTGHSPALPPHTGVCKVLPGKPLERLLQPMEDPLCPRVSGCNIRVGYCDCYSLQTCHHVFFYPSLDECLKAKREDELWSERNEENREWTCMKWGCELQENQCVCMERSCSSPSLSEDACEDLLQKARCSNVSCSEVPVPSCPDDSFLTESHIPPGKCCPLVPAVCTCNFEECPVAPQNCPPGQLVQHVEGGDGRPGSCCNRYQCVQS
ncbi:cysteine-rich motor neuron 1 protein [Esox lucius]|uniref:cysteine-rich motor neuron 1 protein n=1 Tax=Esox lucius TaxID=8010 RepID=UPI000575F8C8|nr:cysteine-rich motor neuron 1 protein [Esox lucius]